MLEVRPFRGLRYNLDRIGDLGDVICPPYDVISSEDQQLYLRRSPYNVVRLELGEDLASDTASSNRYTRAAMLLQGWVGEGILVQEESPAFYITEHRFTHRGATLSRWGLIAAVGVQDWSEGGIRPHEAILKAPAADRLKLLQTCQVNLSPVVSILRCEGKELASLLSQFVDGVVPLTTAELMGVTSSMWGLRDQQSIMKLRELCESKLLYIMDGHHRYQTALTYSGELRDAQPGQGGRRPADFVMMNLIDSGDPGVIVLPTHRLARIAGASLDELRKTLCGSFSVERMPRSGATLEQSVDMWIRAMEERCNEGFVIGMYGLCDEDAYLLSVRKDSSLMDGVGGQHSEAWRELDISLLHTVILERMLKLDASAMEECLEYTRDAVEAVEQVDAGEFQLAFLLNQIPISSVMAVADAGDRMPQKSTYLYPKPPTGLVMNPLWGDNL